MQIKISRDKMVLAAGQSEKEKKYWLNKLAGELVKTHFPYDYGKKFLGKNISVMESIKSLKLMFPDPLYSKIKKLSGNADAKLHMILATGIFLLLHKYTGTNDITIGSPILKQEIEGEFINTVLVFRNGIAAHMSFKELLLEVRKTIIEASENQNYPMEILLEELNMPVMGDEFPLFDTVLLLENLHDKNYLQGIRYSMLFSFSRAAEHIEGIVEYNSLLYREDTVKRIVNHYMLLLDQVLSGLDVPLNTIELLSDQEKRQLLFDFNNTDVDYPGDKLLHYLFEEQVRQTPDNIALYGKNLELNIFISLTYREFNTRTNLFARFLQETGVGADTIVGLMVEPSIEMMIGILGILKSGGAYLPIDPKYPQERIDYMLKDSGAKLLAVANDHEGEKVRRWEGKKVLLLELSKSPKISSYPLALLPSYPLNSSNLAYIIYTSGSTGKPKGVMVEHRNVIAYLHAFNREFQLKPTDTVLQLASYCFDVFIEEVFPVLLNGGRLVIPYDSERKDMDTLCRLIERYRVSMIDCTPLVLNEFNKRYALSNLMGVHTFINGGDVLKEEYVTDLLKTGKVYNTYGPTESTVCATYYRYTGDGTPGKFASVPIGSPITNYKVYILDQDHKLTPIGVAGELCISGPGVTRGYLNRPELTAERFINNRSNKSYKTHCFYKTGDLARWLLDDSMTSGATTGIIEFLGRIDHQVKIRGFRIELGEIESRLAAYKDIAGAAVVVQERPDRGESKDPYICAYVVAREGRVMNIPDLKDYLATFLPAYMMPTFILQVDKIPLTPQGKINRKALPEPQGKIEPGSEYIAPQTVTEMKLAHIWQELLGIEKVGMCDNFFELGGDSILVNRAIARMRKELEIDVSLRTFFERPNIKGILAEVKNDNRLPRIEKVPRDGSVSIPLTFPQERLWFLQQLDKDSASYHVPRCIYIDGQLEVELFERVFSEIIRRHEILRTVFPTIDGRPEQRILKPFTLKIPVIDFSNHGGEEQSQQVSEFLVREGQRLFDLEQGPMLRITLLKLKENRHILVSTEHHLVHDGWTQGLLLKEFIVIYTAFSAGKPCPLPELPFQYADYAVWQREYLQGQYLENQLAYWKQKLSGMPPLLELPIDYPRPSVITNKGAIIEVHFPAVLADSLKAFSKTRNVTLFMTMLAAFKVLLFRYMGKLETVTADICVGTGIAARKLREIEGMMGMVINTIPLRTIFTGDLSFEDFLQEVKRTCLEAYECEDTPFEKIVEVLAPERSLSYTPLLQVLFSFMDIPAQSLHLPGLEFRPVMAHNRSSKFDIDIVVIPPLELEDHRQTTGINIEWEYNSDLFKAETQELMIQHYRRLLEEITAHPGKNLWNLQIMDQAEMEKLLFEWNATYNDFPWDTTVHELFRDQAAKTSNHIALIGSSVERYFQITYCQLNEQSERLARLLIEKGVLADNIVGIMMEPSVEMITGILGIWKAGGAYLPIDPGYPQERIDYMLKDSGARLLVTTSDKEGEKVRRWEGEKVLLEEISFLPKNPAYPLTFLPSYLVNSSNLSYIIYTSGTTGKPKGVLVEHRNVIAYLFAFFKEFDITSADTSIQLASFAFDAFIEEVFPVLLKGGKLIIPAYSEIMDIDVLGNLILKHHVNIIDCTPLLLNEFDKLGIFTPGNCNLDYIFISGGDVLKKEYVANLLKMGKVYNTYGPTESTICAAYYRYTGDNLTSIPIGKPISNYKIYILDKYGHLTPIGAAGELCVSGPGTVRGYLNNPELTAEKFINNRSYRSNKTYICYKTGDLGRWLLDGNIEFLGRIDHQVKVRGFRIELGEIEAELLRHELVKDAVVIDKESETGEKYLCGYIVTKKEFELTMLKEFLVNRLPNYMVPSFFVRVENIPLNLNGKVDLKALPEPWISPGDDYEAPGNEIEEKIRDIWSEVLGKEKSKLSVKANFFDLGGHSLKATIIIARIHKTFNFNLPLTQLFSEPTIRGIASFLEAIKWAHDKDSEAINKLEHEEIVL